MVLFLWWCLCGGVFVVCGGGGVLVFWWWCSCGGVLVVVFFVVVFLCFLWWCSCVFCGGAFLVFFCGGVV